MGKIASFERILFRAMRGNMFLKHQEVGLVMDPAQCEKQNKSVFVVFFSGERSRAKILKICDAFSANRYPLPEEPVKQASMRSEVNARLLELSQTVEASEDQKRTLLLRINHDWDSWMALVKREKMIYHSLNKFNIDVTSKCLVAQGWIPTKNREEILQALKEACLESNAPVNTVFHQVYTNESPPTYFESSKVITAFQSVVDAYGVARYREMNPTVFTIVTFPLCHHVRRHWPRAADAHVRPLYGPVREEDGEEGEERHGRDGFRREIPHPAHVHLQHLHRVFVQRGLLHPYDVLRPLQVGLEQLHGGLHDAGGELALPLWGGSHLARNQDRAHVLELDEDEDVHRAGGVPDAPGDRRQPVELPGEAHGAPELREGHALHRLRVRAEVPLLDLHLWLPRHPDSCQVVLRVQGRPLPADDQHVPVARRDGVRQELRDQRPPVRLGRARRVPGLRRVLLRAMDAPAQALHPEEEARQEVGGRGLRCAQRGRRGLDGLQRDGRLSKRGARGGH